MIFEKKTSFLSLKLNQHENSVEDLETTLVQFNELKWARC